MQSEYDGFVGVYDDAFSAEYCDALVEHFEWCNTNNKTYSRPEAELIKKDQSTNLNPLSQQDISFGAQHIGRFINVFNEVFWGQCYKEYIEKYSLLSNYDKHTIHTYKIQRTDPAGGYHTWHCEDMTVGNSRRIGVYIVYLNDVGEGGETEFLYLSKRIKPKKGRLIIFPPNYPWAHRGNPPLSGTKYILTGWTEFS